jgi:hypothetical protein
MPMTESANWSPVEPDEKETNKSGIKKLRGNRIYLVMPPQDKTSKIEVDHNTKEALQKELILKMSRLTVHTVGELVTDLFPGDIVLVDPVGLNKSTVIPLSEEENVILVSTFDVIHVWE